MLAAMVICSLTVAAVCFTAKTFIEALDFESDPIAREAYEDETRSYGWRLCP